MLAAYDDELGVTAAFNLNLLARINRELDADFILSDFQHEARFYSGLDEFLAATVPFVVEGLERDGKR